MAPCTPWPFENGCGDVEAANAHTLAVALEAATEVLWAASGRVYGTCPVVVRPCGPGCLPSRDPRMDDSVGMVASWSGYPWSPALVGANWVNIRCGCAHACSCSAVERIWLPGGIARVHDVQIGAEHLVISGTGAMVAVDDGQWVTRLDGGAWPLCQNVNANPPAEGTWTVSYDKGWPVPALGRLAMDELTSEFLKLCCGTGDCRLNPNTATMVNRRGVTMMFDPKLVRAGKSIGLPVSDRFLAAANPYGIQDASTGVYSPDLPKDPMIRRTWST